MRSAWSACKTVDYTTTNLCNITTLGTRSMQFNSSYGPLMLSSSDPAIIFSGSLSTVICIDCGVLLMSISGFPYQTGNLSNTNNA
ncbi:hypothetical protein EON65_29595 [archaeon]|nr:MAG: hypothetical protein EON65_29595 [archaeon]